MVAGVTFAAGGPRHVATEIADVGWSSWSQRVAVAAPRRAEVTMVGSVRVGGLKWQHRPAGSAIKGEFG